MWHTRYPRGRPRASAGPCRRLVCAARSTRGRRATPARTALLQSTVPDLGDAPPVGTARTRAECGPPSQSRRQTSSRSLVTATSKLATGSQDIRRLGSDPLSFDIETTSGVSAPADTRSGVPRGASVTGVTYAGSERNARDVACPSGTPLGEQLEAHHRCSGGGLQPCPGRSSGDRRPTQQPTAMMCDVPPAVAWSLTAKWGRERSHW